MFELMLLQGKINKNKEKLELRIELCVLFFSTFIMFLESFIKEFFAGFVPSIPFLCVSSEFSILLSRV